MATVRPRRKAVSALPCYAPEPVEEGLSSDDIEYKAKGILEETRSHYLISWESDGDTHWDPTWEPKANANKLLVDEWIGIKKQKQQQKRDARRQRRDNKRLRRKRDSRSSIATTTLVPAAEEEVESSPTLRNSSPQPSTQDEVPPFELEPEPQLSQEQESDPAPAQTMSDCSLTSASGVKVTNLTTILNRPPISPEPSTQQSSRRGSPTPLARLAPHRTGLHIDYWRRTVWSSTGKPCDDRDSALPTPSSHTRSRCHSTPPTPVESVLASDFYDLRRERSSTVFSERTDLSLLHSSTFPLLDSPSSPATERSIFADLEAKVTKDQAQSSSTRSLSVLRESLPDSTDLIQNSSAVSLASQRTPETQHKADYAPKLTPAHPGIADRQPKPNINDSGSGPHQLTLGKTEKPAVPNFVRQASSSAIGESAIASCETLVRPATPACPSHTRSPLLLHSPPSTRFRRAQASGSGRLKSPVSGRLPATFSSREVAISGFLAMEKLPENSAGDQPQPNLHAPPQPEASETAELKDAQPPGDTLLRSNRPLDESDINLPSDSTSESGVSSLSEENLLAPFPGLAGREFAVALPWMTSVADYYQECLGKNRKFLREFCDSNASVEDLSLVQRASQLLAKLKGISTHVDLNMRETPGGEQPTPKQLVQWDVRNSKFAFLGGLIDLLRQSSVHILVVCSDTVVDILARFFTGNEVQWRQLHGGSIDEGPSTELCISILVCNTENQKSAFNRPDLIIDFDTSLAPGQTYEPIERVRRSPQNVSDLAKWVPIVHLFLRFSIEHIALCLPEDIEGPERLQHLLYKATALQHDIKTKSAPQTPLQAAALTAAYISATPDDNSMTEWPLPDPAVLSGFVLPHQVVSHDSGSAERQHSRILKRQLENTSHDGSHKRARHSEETRLPTSTDNSVRKTTTERSQAPPTRNAEEKSIDSPSGSEREEEEEEEDEKREDAAGDRRTVETLQNLNRNLRLRLEDWKKALNDSQYKCEDGVREMRVLAKVIDRLNEQNEQWAKMLEAKDARIKTLNDHKSKLADELSLASEALRSSSVAGLREFESLRTAAKENVVLKERIKSYEKELSYLRAEYQNVSLKAQSLSHEVQNAESKISHLETQASSRVVELRAMRGLDETEAYKREIEAFQRSFADYESLLSRLMKEVTVLRNHRTLATRQSSMGPLSRRNSPDPLQLGSYVARLSVPPATGARELGV